MGPPLWKVWHEFHLLLCVLTAISITSFFFLFVAKVREMMQRTSSVFQCDLYMRLCQQNNALIKKNVFQPLFYVTICYMKERVNKCVHVRMVNI